MHFFQKSTKNDYKSCLFAKSVSLLNAFYIFPACLFLKKKSKNEVLQFTRQQQFNAAKKELQYVPFIEHIIGPQTLGLFFLSIDLKKNV